MKIFRYDKVDRESLAYLKEMLNKKQMMQVLNSELTGPELQHIKYKVEEKMAWEKVEEYLKPENNSLFRMLEIDSFFDKEISLSRINEYDVRHCTLTEQILNLEKADDIPVPLQENPIILQLYTNLLNYRHDIIQLAFRYETAMQFDGKDVNITSLPFNEVIQDENFKKAVKNEIMVYNKEKDKIKYVVEHNGFENETSKKEAVISKINDKKEQAKNENSELEKTHERDRVM